ncbi:hypothetical protein N431DRAFT_323306 [Stipitochalara longipes BDJ]|nr:hypothetical protein N431DRAFT_323306 [Stipitochalara longipes BDJ]
MDLTSDSEKAPKAKVKTEVKPDPDTSFTSIATAPGSAPLLRIKKEEDLEEDYGKIDRSLPEAQEEDNMFEDVDEDEYVDLTYEGIAHVNGVRHFVCEGFKIRQIPEPFIVKRSLLHLFQCIESKAIVLDPDYQRDVVWDEGRGALLITSILMGYFIPPIIFNVRKTVIKVEGQEKEKYTRTTVDGKQRLSSIWKFMSGQIGFFDTNTPQRKWYYCHPIVNGREVASGRNILPRAVKEFFQNQFFCCYEYEELSLDTEETMFQLVQRGIALTPAEKMRAMSTEWAAFAKQYEDDYVLIVSLSKQSRASGFRLVLTIFTMIQEVMARNANKKKHRHSRDAPTLQASPQALLRVLDDQGDINPALKLKMKAIFDRYEGLVKLCSVQYTATKFKVKLNTVFHPSPKFLTDIGVNHVRTFSPLELVVTAILIAVHMDYRSDNQLLDDIKAMRQYLRIEHKDLRVNAQCWGTSWFYITEIMDRRRGLKPVSNPPVEDPMMKIRQAIEQGPPRRPGPDGEFSDSPLSSAPSSDNDDETMDEADTSSSSEKDPDATESEDEEDDIRPRPSRRALGKRRATLSKRQTSKSKPKPKKSAKRSRKPEKKSRIARPVKKARKARRNMDITFDQLR